MHANQCVKSKYSRVYPRIQRNRFFDSTNRDLMYSGKHNDWNPPRSVSTQQHVKSIHSQFILIRPNSKHITNKSFHRNVSFSSILHGKLMSDKSLCDFVVRAPNATPEKINWKLVANLTETACRTVFASLLEFAIRSVYLFQVHSKSTLSRINSPSLRLK